MKNKCLIVLLILLCFCAFIKAQAIGGLALSNIKSTKNITSIELDKNKRCMYVYYDKQKSTYYVIIDTTSNKIINEINGILKKRIQISLF